MCAWAGGAGRQTPWTDASLLVLGTQAVFGGGRSSPSDTFHHLGCARLSDTFVPISTSHICCWRRRQTLCPALPIRAGTIDIGDPLFPPQTPPLALPTSAGIVQGQAQVERVEEAPAFRALTLRFPAGALDGVAVGGSIAVNGTCLTVTEFGPEAARFDVVSETLARTNLGKLQPGQPVNFERAARLGDEIGGHHMSGHVCTTARIVADATSEHNRRLELEVRGGRGWGGRRERGGGERLGHCLEW